mgnify:CR=1 FL=1
MGTGEGEGEGWVERIGKRGEVDRGGKRDEGVADDVDGRTVVDRSVVVGLALDRKSVV